MRRCGDVDREVRVVSEGNPWHCGQGLAMRATHAMHRHPFAADLSVSARCVCSESLAKQRLFQLRISTECLQPVATTGSTQSSTEQLRAAAQLLPGDKTRRLPLQPPSFLLRRANEVLSSGGTRSCLRRRASLPIAISCWEAKDQRCRVNS